jgi:hypothetical protein
MAGTKGDRIRLYGTSGDIVRGVATMLGGYRSATQLQEVGIWVRGDIVNIAVVGASGANSGTGMVSCVGGYYTYWSDSADSATAGPGVAMVTGQTVTLEAADDDKWVTVTRTDANDSIGELYIDFAPLVFSALPVLVADDVSYANGYANYMCVCLRNDSVDSCTGLSLLNNTIASEAITGYSTDVIEGTSFADFPQNGFIRVIEPGGTLRAALYYSHRTTTALYIEGQPGQHFGASGTPTVGDTVQLYGGFAMAVDTPSSNRVQDVANAMTAPSGLTWSCLAAGVNIGTLAAGAEAFVWFWIPATVYNQQPYPADFDANLFFQGGAREIKASLGITYASNAVTYLRNCDLRRAVIPDQTDAKDCQARGLWFTSDATISRAPGDATEWKVGDASDTDFTVDLTAYLPSAGEYATVYYTCRKVDMFGLLSQNDYAVPVIIDENGDEVFPISDPYGISITDDTNGYVRVQASYSPGLDVSPADTWAIYYTDNGIDPDPATDTPYTETMTLSALSGSRTINHLLGPFTHLDTVKVLVRAHRVADGEESANTAITSVTASARALPPSAMFAWRGTAVAIQGTFPGGVGTTYLIGTDGAYAVVYEDEVQVWASDAILWWRQVGSKIYVPHNNTYGAKPSVAGADPITGAASPWYMNVDGSSVGSLTVASGTEGDWLTQGISIADLSAETNVGPFSSASGKVVWFTYKAGAWVPYLRVQTDGILDVDDGYDIAYVATQLEALTR